jgi:hypothetical protein
MRWVVGIVLTLIAIVGVVALIGFFLPVNHEASRSAAFNRPPADVFALISDIDHYTAWWPEATVKVAVVESAPPSKFVTKIVGETAFGGTWTMEVVPTPGGSRLTITERGEVYNVIFRTLSKFVFGYTGTMDSCLAAAAKRLAT